MGITELMNRNPKCIFGHKWDGCTCKRCNQHRDEQHHWNGCKCLKCYKKRDEAHDWNGCVCKICGIKREHNEHEWIKEVITPKLGGAYQVVRCRKCHKTKEGSKRSMINVCPKCDGDLRTRSEPEDTPESTLIKVITTCKSCGYETSYERSDSY